MKSFLNAKQARGKKIYFANTASVTTDISGVHPAQEGDDLFAQVIFDIMNAHL